jgi:hypothetical protein
VLRALVAAAVGDIGASRWLIACECVSSVRLKCSTPRSDRSDGPSRACLRGAGSAAAVIVGLISGRARLLPQRHQQCWRARNLDPTFAAQFQRIQGFSRTSLSVIERPDRRSEATRGAVAPEPKEWS